MRRSASINVVEDGKGFILSNIALVQALPSIAPSDLETALLTESLVEAITISDDEAKARVHAFLEK